MYVVVTAISNVHSPAGIAACANSRVLRGPGAGSSASGMVCSVGAATCLSCGGVSVGGSTTKARSGRRFQKSKTACVRNLKRHKCNERTHAICSDISSERRLCWTRVSPVQLCGHVFLQRLSRAGDRGGCAGCGGQEELGARDSRCMPSITGPPSPGSTPPSSLAAAPDSSSAVMGPASSSTVPALTGDEPETMPCTSQALDYRLVIGQKMKTGGRPCDLGWERYDYQGHRQ